MPVVYRGSPAGATVVDLKRLQPVGQVSAAPLQLLHSGRPVTSNLREPTDYQTSAAEPDGGPEWTEETLDKRTISGATVLAWSAGGRRVRAIHGID